MATRIWRGLGLAAWFVPGFVGAQELPGPLTDVLARLDGECPQTLDIRHGAITRQPLGDTGGLGRGAGWVVDEAHIICAPLGADHNCGTGGCPVHFVAGEIVTTRLARSWRLTEMAGQTIILLEVHGSRCGASGAAACFEALTFDPSGRALGVGRQ